jgi:hypothetical protein
MGIDYHGFQFLRFAARRCPLGDVVTIGRQGIYVPEFVVREHFDLPADYRHGTYCERLVQACFGARRVDSIDRSDYEGATCILDMNQPLPAVGLRYDTVIDFGTLEHVYNIAQAFENVAELTKVGGQILHVLPANNFCGHGFWQMSPELFFTLYSEENGYAETRVFLADITRFDCWFEVIRPEHGRRALVETSSPVHVMCRALKVGGASRATVQQSDYVYQWERWAAARASTRGEDAPTSPERFEGGWAARTRYRIKRSPLGRLAVSMKRRLDYRQRRGTSLSGANPHLVKHPISKLTSPAPR